jgi:hypothetical protein
MDVLGIGVRANGFWDMELEFLDRQFFEVNYWGKDEKVVS